jgi:hypothetical protein
MISTIDGKQLYKSNLSISLIESPACCKANCEPALAAGESYSLGLE